MRIVNSAVIVLLLLASCDGVEDATVASSEASHTKEKHPDLVDFPNYSIEDHLEINLFTPNMNILTESERSYVSRAREDIKPYDELDSLKADVVLMFYANSKVVLSMSDLIATDLYAAIDSLLMSDILTQAEKEQLKLKYSSIVPYRYHDELAIQYVKRFEGGSDLVNRWNSQDDEFKEMPDTARQIAFSRLHVVNMMKMLKKYEEQVPEISNFVRTGTFLKALNQDLDESDKQANLQRFTLLLRTEEEENIMIARDALLSKYELTVDELYTVEDEISTAISYLKNVEVNFTDDNQYQADSGGELLTEISNKYQGKVIFIDLWATWCKPCLAEMKNGKETKQYYSDKDVVFVYLCGGNCRRYQMQKKINEYDIVGEHYVLTNRETEDLFQIFGRRGFPLYRVIDKNGNLLKDAWLRPSNFYQIKNTLDPLL